MKLAFHDISPGVFNLIRFSAVSLILGIFLPPRNVATHRPAVKAGLILGVLFSLGVLLRVIGLVLTTATKASFISNFYVIIVPILAVVIYKHPPKRAAAIGTFFTVFGLYFMTMPAGWELNFGDLLNSFAACFYAFHLIYLQIFSEKYDFKTLFFFQMVAAIPINLAYVLVFEQSTAKFTPNVFIALIYTSVFSLLFALGIHTRFQKDSTPTKVAIIHVTEPIWAAFSAYPIIGEILKPVGWLGASLIFIGFLIAEIGVPRKQNNS